MRFTYRSIGWYVRYEGLFAVILLQLPTRVAPISLSTGTAVYYIYITVKLEMNDFMMSDKIFDSFSRINLESKKLRKKSKHLLLNTYVISFQLCRATELVANKKLVGNNHAPVLFHTSDFSAQVF